MKNNIDFLQNELVRTSEWLKFAEQKFTLLSIYYWLWITYIIHNQNKILKLFIEYSIFKIFIFLIFIFTLLSWIYFLFKVIFPNLNNISTNKSFFFFKHISNMKILDFIKNFKNLTNKEKENQILEQIHTNSIIANEKMNNITNSSKILFINLIFFIIIVFLI